MNNISEADLKRLYLFRSVNLESVQGALDACTVRTAAPGDVIIRAGHPNRHVYLLLEGHLRVHPHSITDEPMVVIGPGEMVGEISVIDQQPASSYIVAGEPCRLMVMDEDILWSLIQSSHAAARNLLFILASRLRHADRMIMGDVPTGEDFDHYGSVDALTGLRSRKWLDHMIQRQFMRSSTCGDPLSLLMIDIDHFKDFNNQHGHAYGDRVLYAIAQTFSNHLRPIDIIARYGGDEFIIVLPNIPITAAREVANRLHREVMKAVPLMPDWQSIPHPTLSIGLAEICAGQTPEMLMTAADAALHRAKKSGGNCIVG
jgi:two-component system, cell cycle response regulator